jgi:glycosyltransferase involved in cell wall biosynthesis
MRTGYIPKDQRKKILLLSDDMRVTSGVGVMSREIVEGTCHHYNWIQVGAGVNHPEMGKIVDMSDAVSNETQVPDASVRIYPYNGYGDSRLIRQLIDLEQPDAILHFTDPRYWIWLYQIEHEIRQHIPMFFYAIWDDLPYPFYNEWYYQSDDWIGCISKQTYNIVKQVSREKPREPWSVSYVPHGINTKRFYPLPEDDAGMLETRKNLFGDDVVDYVILYNSRNIRRKQTSDIIYAFNVFMSKLSDEQKEKVRLVLHTQPVDDNGTDLNAVIRDVTPNVKKYIIFSPHRTPPEYLNHLYNIADVTINMSSNEGFGLGTCESIICGTPIIVNVTGGLQDQCGFMDDEGNYLDHEKHFTYDWGSNHDGKYKKHGEWAFPMFPTNRSLQGSPLTPYIFDDRASFEDAAERMMEVYQLSRQERKRRGHLGREYALGPGQFTAERMSDLFIQHMDSAFENWTPRKKFELVQA